MKILSGLVLILIAINFSSCKDPAQKTKTLFVTDTTKVTDTVIFIRDSLAGASFADSVPAGLYHGMFPCADCDGIQQIISFDSGRKFRLEEQVWGKTVKPVKKKGTWEIKDGQVWLYTNGRVIAKLLHKGDSLRIVEQNSSHVSSADSNRYMLTKAAPATSNPAWMKKKQEGVDFMAIGNEPFWSLEIDKEKFILFKLADWKKAVIVPIESPKVSGDSTVYTVVADNNLPLRIAIYPEFGSDGMSDFLYEYKAVVRYMGVIYTGRGLYLN